MPVVQLDWVRIKSKLGDVTGLYFLTHRQASLLLSLSEQLTWRKTYRAFEYDFSDWDDVQMEVADLQRYLSMPVNLVDLVGYIDDIEDLLIALQTIGVTSSPCCENVAPISETKESDEDYPGTPPATWGDGEEIEDAADWKHLVCGAASMYVDILKATAEDLEKLVVSGGIVLGAIAGALTLLAGAGIVLAIGYGAAAAITTGIVKSIVLGTFGDSGQDLEDARESIMCAIVSGVEGALSDAVEAAVGGLAWSLWYSFIDYDSAWGTMIDGYNKNGFLDVVRSSDCDWCEEELEPHQLLHNPDLTLGIGAWYVDTPFVWASTQVNITDEYTSYDRFIGVDSEVVEAGYAKLQLKTTCFSHAVRECVWYFKTYRASDDGLVHTDNQVCNGHDGLFHEEVHPKFTVTPGEKYYVKCAITSNYGMPYAITKIEAWESVS
jgi:hypothetical protein